MSLIERYQENYLSGFDCRLTTYRNSLACNGLYLSNAMCLGLSGTLVFACNYGQLYKTHGVPVVTGMSDQSLEGLTANTNSYILRSTFNVNDDWASEIKNLINHGIPVNVAVNRGKLHELCGIGNGERSFIADMGFHYVSIVGFDEKKRVFSIFETNDSKEIKIKEDELREAWFFDVIHGRVMRDHMQSCNGQWYGIMGRDMDSERIVRAGIVAIRNVVENFYSSTYPEYLGIGALDTFQNVVNSWRDNAYGKERLSLALNFLQVTGVHLSGGGMGRRLYSYFIDELSKLKQDSSLKEIGIEFKTSANKWRLFLSRLNTFKDKGDFHNLLDEFTPSLIELENKQMKLLNDWVEVQKI